MELTTNDKKHLRTSSNHSEIQLSKKVREATDQEILMQLAYIMALIGIPDNKKPIDIEKRIMVSYIKLNWHYEELEVMKKSFEWAIEKTPRDRKNNPLITLYDRSFNIEYIKSIINSYKQNRFSTKARTDESKEEGMTNHKRAEGIIGMIAKQNPELYEKLKSIGKEKPKPNPQQNKSTQEIKGVFKKYEEEFYKLRETTPEQFVEYDNKKLNFSEYCNYRFEQDYPTITEEETEQKKQEWT